MFRRRLQIVHIIARSILFSTLCPPKASSFYSQETLLKIHVIEYPLLEHFIITVHNNRVVWAFSGTWAVWSLWMVFILTIDTTQRTYICDKLQSQHRLRNMLSQYNGAHTYVLRVDHLVLDKHWCDHIFNKNNSCIRGSGNVTSSRRLFQQRVCAAQNKMGWWRHSDLSSQLLQRCWKMKA